MKISLIWNKLENLSDKQLIEKTKNWNKKAFEVFYDRRSKSIYNYIRTILNYNDQDATALLSDIYIKMYDIVLTKDIPNPKSYLYSMSRNMSIDFIRTNKSENKFEYDDSKFTHLEDTENHLEKAEQKQIQQIVKTALQKLETKYREVLYLYYYEEKDYLQIAEIIWSNKNSVWTLIFQAKKKLKPLIEKYWIQL